MSLETVLDSLGVKLTSEKIGGGGSAFVHKGIVVAARPELPRVGTNVAIKEYLPSILTVPGQRERIQQEAELGRTIQHPNLVKAFDIALSSDEGREESTVLILEWVDGATLDKWYAAEPKPVSWEKIRSICDDLVRGVRELHKNNVFHRDIKPENVMVRRNGTAVLMDIGVAEVTDNNEHTLHTTVKDFLGSVRFASPQFIMGENYTPADDVYSLGATFFLLFTGRLVYSEVERKPVIPIAVVDSPPRVDSLQEGIPASMRILLTGCLRREPRRRPTLEQIQDCLQNPSTAKYITSELEKETAETRSYEVLDVLEGGGAFFADLGGDKPRIDDDYRVIRIGKKILVPSLGREVAREVAICEATLKHVNSGLGYFVVLEKRWKETSRAPLHSVFSNTGQWVDDEKVKFTVKPGDLVLKGNSDD